MGAGSIAYAPGSKPDEGVSRPDMGPAVAMELRLLTYSSPTSHRGCRSHFLAP
jgi:hypothetical protein